MLQARAPAITGCPDLPFNRARRAVAVKDPALAVVTQFEICGVA